MRQLNWMLTITATLMGAACMQAQTSAPMAPMDHMQMPMAAPAGPVGPAGEVQRSYAALKVNILKAADNMPPDAYAYKPEPDIRTFARVVNHISEAQLRSCGAVNGTSSDALAKVPAETAAKAEVVAALRASYAECDKAYASATDGNFSEMIQLGKTKRSRGGFLWGNVSHDNEQYATLALYMRLKGLVPPSSEK